MLLLFLSCFYEKQAKIEIRVHAGTFSMLNSDNGPHHNDDAGTFTVIILTVEVVSSQPALVFECAVAKPSYTLGGERGFH